MYYSTLSEISGLKIDVCKNLGKPHVCVISTGMAGSSDKIVQEYAKLHALHDLNEKGIIELIIITMREPPSENAGFDVVAEFDKYCASTYEEHTLANFDLLVVGSRGGKYAASLLKNNLWEKSILFFGTLKILDCCRYANGSQRFVFVHGEYDMTQPCIRTMEMYKKQLEKHKFFCIGDGNHSLNTKYNSIENESLWYDKSTRTYNDIMKNLVCIALCINNAHVP